LHCSDVASDMTCSAGNSIPQPNAEVTKLENAMVQGGIASQLAASSLDSQLPPRPAYGIKGKAIVLYTNYFELQGIKPELDLYRYSISFLPDNKLPKPKKKRLVQLLLNTAPFQGLPVASDWAQMLVTPEEIPLEDHRGSFKLEWYPADGAPLPAASSDEPDHIGQTRARNTHTVLVEPLGTASVRDMLADISQPTSTYPLKLETIQALNILMAHSPGSDVSIATAGGNRFYPFGGHPHVEKTRLGGGLEALRGYFSSVRTSVNRILVNVNVATGAFYRSGPLLEVMKDFTGGQPPANFSQQQRLSTFVRKLRFETNYIPDTDSAGKPKKGSNGKPLTRRKVHTITALSKHGENATNTMFPETLADGSVRQVTVQAYYKAKYNITLQFLNAPLVNYGGQPVKDGKGAKNGKDAKNQTPKWIPAELCTILPGQLAKRLLLGPQTAEMIKFAARRPHENAQSITGNGLLVTKINPVVDGVNTNLSRFGIKGNIHYHCIRSCTSFADWTS
jgi:eukaryotic translation initiation factor 2C